MVNNKVISDVLSCRHRKPIASSWVQVDKISEIVELVVQDPIFGSIAAPQFRVSCLLFLEPDCSVALKPSSWKSFPVFLWLNDLHIQQYNTSQTTRIPKGNICKFFPKINDRAFLLLISISLSTEPIMNQKTLQNIYKSFETEEFYRRYLVDLGCREDRRSVEEQRKMRVTSKNNSVVLSCGQTIIIAHVEAAIEQVTFSPVSNSYGEPLLKLKVNNANNNHKYRENKADKAVQQYVLSKTQWGIVEDQLSGSDLITGKQYAYKGQIVVRILGDDGGVEEFCLLAVQLLLLTCKFKKFTVNKEKIEFKDDFSLIIKSFIYPIKYCEILGKILVDPSLSEEQNSDFVVTVLKDLRQPENVPTVIQKSKKNTTNSSEQNLLSIMKRWQCDLARALSTFEQKVISLESSSQCILN